MNGDIVHIVPTIFREASGPSYSVMQLCRALADNDCDVKLAVLEPAPQKAGTEFIHSFPYGTGPGRLGFSPQMRRWLRKGAVCGQTRIFHNHSLWMMPNIYPSWAIKGTQCKLVMAPRGTLSKWALNHSVVVKKIIWLLFQKASMKNATAFHATSQEEYQDIRRMGLTQPVAIIPNGMDLPDLSFDLKKRKTVMFLSRIHPKKGIPLLLEAWSRLEPDFPDWDLTIVGPDENGYLEDMRGLAEKLSLQRCQLPGPVFGAKKQSAYSKASIFVLPTHSENFGLVVAEALAAGTPAIVSKGAPWAGLEREGAGWWIDIGVEPLVVALQEAMQLPPEKLAQMGQRGREWMQRDFAWKKIAQDMALFYEWLEHGGKAPDFVRVE